MSLPFIKTVVGLFFDWTFPFASRSPAEVIPYWTPPLDPM